MDFPESRWISNEADEGVVEGIVRERGIPSALARALAGRGISDPASADAFLNPRLSQLSDPFLLPGMPAAVERIRRAVARKERITVFGDYDVDGISATALLVQVLRALNAHVTPFLPDRHEEGYGLTSPALTRCIRETQPDLVITVDCGTCSADAVAVLGAPAPDLVVTDHHEISGALTPACAMVNPKCGAGQDDAMFLAGVGVAFKLCHALVKKGLERNEAPARGIDLRRYLDLVLVGTIADMVPLQGENRILTRHGLRRLESTDSEGLRALKKIAGIRGPADGRSLAFGLAPRLNAAGRMGRPGRALDLLLTEEASAAELLAQEVDQYNHQRRETGDRIFEEAVQEIHRWFDPAVNFGLVVGHAGWHSGVSGIVAGRLCEYYQRPAVVIAFDGEGKGRGSARSAGALDLVSVFEECRDLLVSAGGHKMAAGLVLEQENLASFAERFDRLCAERLRHADLRRERTVDAWIQLGEIDNRLVESLVCFEPTGMGNDTPCWGTRRARVAGKPQPVGKEGQHLRLVLASGGYQFEAMAFGMGKREIPEGDLDVYYTLAMNEYGGYRKIQLYLKDLKPSEDK